MKIPFTVFDLFFLSTRKRTNTAMAMAAEATDATTDTKTFFVSDFLLESETRSRGFLLTLLLRTSNAPKCYR